MRGYSLSLLASLLSLSARLFARLICLSERDQQISPDANGSRTMLMTPIQAAAAGTLKGASTEIQSSSDNAPATAKDINPATFLSAASNSRALSSSGCNRALQSLSSCLKIGSTLIDASESILLM